MNFDVRAHVERVQSPTIPDKLGAVMLHVGLRCKDCESEFWFPGLPTGTDYGAPTTSTDGFTLTAPAVQANCRNLPEAGLVKMILGNVDAQKGYRS